MGTRGRQKPSGIAAKETVLRVHLLPVLGGRKLDAITNEDIQRLKHRLSCKAPKTVNNVLTVLNKLLATAVEWQVIDQMPCTVRLVRVPRTTAKFHDFDPFERLVAAAERLEATTHLIVLLGGEAGLRCGEMMALEWDDVDFASGKINVELSEWKGQVTTTKGGRVRFVDLTLRLAKALRAHRHLRSKRVLCQPNGDRLTQKIVQDHVRRAARRASKVRGRSRLAPHVLLASRDAGRTRTRYSGTRRT